MVDGHGHRESPGSVHAADSPHDEHLHHHDRHHVHHGGDVAGGSNPDERQPHERHPHDKHAGHDPEVFRRKFWLSLVLTVPVVLTSGMVMDWFGYHIDGVGWVAPLLGTIVYVYGGQPFIVGAITELRDRAPGMMVLVAMAITVAWFGSAASTIGWVDLEFWWELAALVTIMLLGHWQEMKAIGHAQGALAALAALLPDEAEVIGPDEVRQVPVAAVRAGDLVLVRPGGRVPADGVIDDGTAEMDESMVTGESKPVAKSVGDRVVAGTVSTDSSLRIRVSAVGEDTALAGIQRLVAAAQASRSRAQVLADRFAAVLVYVALASALLSFVIWVWIAEWVDGVTAGVTVLVVACPHALGLAIPLVVSISTAVSARSGILVKDRLALERMRTIDAVLFDKTGTLTKGSHVVTDVATAPGVDREAVLAIAAAIERDSEHPLARAIVAASAGSDHLVASGFRALTGRGVEAEVDGRRYALGGPALLRQRGLDTPESLRDRAADWERRGASVLHLLGDEGVMGAFALEDEVRTEAKEAVEELHRLGVRHVVMITGDSRAVAEAVAADVGIDEVFAEVLPEDKDAAVQQLQGRGLTVAMVGDGVNDAPALARADVGLAIGAGTDVAIESAGVVLAGSDPRSVAAVIRLSRASYRKMRQNLAWAAGYNVIAIPLAAGALASWGVRMPPAAAAILMSLSTIIVAANAQLLRRVRLLDA
jgi:P-type Cu2+ transporter